MSRSSYHPLSIVLHWLMFLLFAAALLFIELRGTIPRETGQALRDQLRNWHISVGILVLLAAVIRLGVRWRVGVPAAIVSSPLQDKAAALVHLALYLVMFLLPVTGIVFSQAGGRDVALFGWTLPVLVGHDPSLRGAVKAVHELLGNAVYFLVGLHVVGALWHHLVVKDDTLRRMLPHHKS
ncbi:cytochrome b [Paludibacterium yongneupense]|uniref:cytochrome b n=1 Tax=Paludibacterium yongneupense TaxID=400061 RepID=UPI000409D231|nr:cytochrome b [Paludibacterium yongneupense]